MAVDKKKPGEVRLNINALLPDEKYAIQVRAVDNDGASDWSQKYHIVTIDDTAGQTRLPNAPVLTSFYVDASGQYIATWNSVNTNTDGSNTVVSRYELEIASQTSATILPHYGQSGPTQARSLNFGHLRAFFGGVIPTVLTARLRVINSVGTVSEWSEPLTASLPVPNPPENPAAESVIDAIKVTWQPPADPIHLFGYRVYMSRIDENFIPDQMGRSNLVYEGGATEFAYTSLSYELMHYFKIVSYSEAGLESTWVTTQGQPKSPYGPDDVPPLVPTLDEPTMNSDRTVAAQASLSWSIQEDHKDNKDISGFVVAWRMQGEERWRNSYFEKNARNGVIDMPRPFANYEFKVAAYDFVANYSEFSDVQPLEAAGPPPEQVTGVDGVGRYDGIRVVWNASESQAVVNGGTYEVQFKNTNSFTTDTPSEYKTGNTFIDVTGLTPFESTWYFRVRAVDVLGRPGPWSVVVSKVLPPFPVQAETDGVAPSTPPGGVRAVGGLNYVNISWNRVTNNDEVKYEIFMNPSPGVTAIPANFAGESSGTSFMVNALPNGNALAQDTNYYFKVRAIDADGSGPLSTEVSSQLTQVLSTDLGINMSGENLYYNSSFDTDSDGNGLANYWAVYNNSPSTEPATPSLVAGRTGEKAQRITWTGVNSTTKGVYSTGAAVTKRDTEYILSFYARSNGGTGFDLRFAQLPVGGLAGVTWLENPAPSATVWQRYIAKFTTTGVPDPGNAYITIKGHTGNGGWVEFDDAQIEAGNVASAYKTGTVSIAKLATGKFETADMIIATGGRVMSNLYQTSGGTKGYLLTDQGLTLKSGQVDAGTLVANTTITSNLYVGAKLEVATSGAIQSANYSTTGSGAGYKIGSLGIDIRSGSVAAGALIAGTITSPDIRLGAGGKLTIDANGQIVSNNYSNGVSGFKISNVGIEMWDANSKINVKALETGTLTSTVITLGSGGIIQSAGWVAGTGARFKIDEAGLEMINGSIIGSTIVTDQLYSAQFETVAGTTRRKFSISGDGYAEFSGGRVYGNMRIGSNGSHAIESGTYNGVTGWRIQGDGNAAFFNVNTYSMNVYWAATVGGDPSHHLKSASFAYGSAGWIIRGDGYAEFNGGLLRVGSAWGGLTELRDHGGNAQIRMFVPGDLNRWNTVRAAGEMFEMRGAYGGAVEMYRSEAWWTGRSLVRLIQDVDITSRLFVGNNITVYQGGLWVQNGGIAITNGGFEMGGELRLNSYADGGGGARPLVIGDGGVVQLGGSSKRYKDNIKNLDVRKEDVLSLKPREFDWNKNSGHSGHSVGFIAEEADSLGLDKWVYYKSLSKGSEPVPDGFDYEGFTAALLMVAQEQQKEIDELKTQVAKLVKANS